MYLRIHHKELNINELSRERFNRYDHERLLTDTNLFQIPYLSKIVTFLHTHHIGNSCKNAIVLLVR